MSTIVMRDLAVGLALFVTLVVVASLPNAATRVAGADAAARPTATAPATTHSSGPGFALCSLDPTATAPSPDGRVAVLATEPVAACWTTQPQVFLFGYEATGYDAQDAKLGVLHVRPADGYRLVVLTGPIRAQIAVTADRRVGLLDVPAAWVTPSR